MGMGWKASGIMAGPLIINHGSPDWWLSPDIWVTPHGAPPTSPGVTPEAGKTYDVQVRVYNNYTLPVTDWNLFVCWAIPTVGPIPVPPAGQMLNGTPYGSPVSIPAGYPGYSQIFTANTPWTPIFENGGHECLVAAAYFQVIGFPFSAGLNGDAAATGDYSIAQHNLGVVQLGHMQPTPRRFNYAFQAFNGADQDATSSSRPGRRRYRISRQSCSKCGAGER